MGHLGSYKNFEHWGFYSEVEYPDTPGKWETTDFVLQGKSTYF